MGRDRPPLLLGDFLLFRFAVGKTHDGNAERPGSSSAPLGFGEMELRPSTRDDWFKERKGPRLEVRACLRGPGRPGPQAPGSCNGTAGRREESRGLVRGEALGGGHSLPLDHRPGVQRVRALQRGFNPRGTEKASCRRPGTGMARPQEIAYLYVRRRETWGPVALAVPQPLHCLRLLGHWDILFLHVE